MSEERSWPSAEGAARERLRSGKSFSVKVACPLPDGTEQVATLSDNDQAHWVAGVMSGVVVLGGIFANLIAWAPARRGD